MATDPVPDRGRTVRESNRLRERAAELVPRGSQTMSKRPGTLVEGVSPSHIEHAEGCRIRDVDGNEYIDFNMALGPIVLGYSYPAVETAVEEQLEDGTVFPLEHPLQVEVAELLTGMVPTAEMVQFAKNGNDVTTLAARVARAHTGRDVIATYGYHGWPDVWTAGSAQDAGVPDRLAEYTEEFDLDDPASLEAVFRDHEDDVAAVVMRPLHGGHEAPPEGTYDRIRELCDREGALLVLDEIYSGFRYAPGGAQEHFGIEPDLSCFAKGISNGYPLSALVGREAVMRTMEREDFFFSATYAGEAASLAAAKATLEEMQQEDVSGHIWEVGVQFREGYNGLARDHGLSDVTECVGLGPSVEITFESAGGAAANTVESLFMQEAHRRGVFYSGHQFCYSHSAADIEEALSVYDEAMAVLASAIRDGDVEGRLDGPPMGANVTAWSS
ncbi:MAG: aminotransferase class III-fold pyridoxal phosphate-dependent enzyme [Halobacteriales archaeon]